MSTAVDTASPTAPEPPTRPAGRFSELLRAEVHRLLARSFIRVVLALAVLGWLGAVVLALTQFSSPTPERLAEARTAMQQSVALSERFRQDCLDDPARPAEISGDDWCGPAQTVADLRAADFLDPPAFSLAAAGVEGAIAVGVLSAMLAFLLGATFVGAEWSSRSIVAQLFWEPRRARVMGAKLLVAAAASVVLGVLAQLAWPATAGLLQALVGDGAPLPDDFWPELAAAAGRGVLLTLLAGLLGLGLTNLVRNTGAALGIGFVYFAVLETAVNVLRPAWQPWLLTNNAAALALPGGLELSRPVETVDAAGRPVLESAVYVLGSVQAGVYLGLVTAAITGLGVVLFARRDVH
ncbi:ABC transporter permease subunit [Modestobacter lapidis]|nr:ABC transporter permease subunit [Modestobacter lapidis]